MIRNISNQSKYKRTLLVELAIAHRRRLAEARTPDEVHRAVTKHFKAMNFLHTKSG